MKVSNQAYPLIDGKLLEAEQVIINGVQNRKEAEALLKVKTCIDELRQIVLNHFFTEAEFDESDDNPPAA